MLFLHGIGPFIAALLSHAWVIADAIQADLQVRAALMAAFRASGQARNRVFPPAIMTMALHPVIMHNHCWRGNPEPFTANVSSPRSFPWPPTRRSLFQKMHASES